MLRCGGTGTTLASHSQAQTRVGSPFMGGGTEVGLKAPRRPAGSVRGEAGGGAARSGGDPWEVPDPDPERPGGRLRAYLVEVGVPCHGVAALVGVAAAGGFGLHGERTVRGGVGPERRARGARAVRAAEAAGTSARTAAAALAAQEKGPGPGAGMGGERGWTRREEPARSRCALQDRL